MGYYGFRPYVSVAKRREKALREMTKLQKKGRDISPIVIEGRKITDTFWGQAWCRHMESFSDYENRLPRGRTYVRNGSVCHLAINQQCIEGIVSGSSLYKVRIDIKPLPVTRWKRIKKACAGQIGSLLDLLKGQLADGVMQMVCDKAQGLFPSPKDITLSCSCPDWAVMCKHVAAVLYGVGARLDHAPEKLFYLRGVDHNELVDASTIILETTQDTGSGRRRIDDRRVADVFDIDLSATRGSARTKKTIKKTLPSAKKVQHKLQRTPPQHSAIGQRVPRYFSGDRIRKKRQDMRLSQKEFSQRIGVSAATISNWERQGRYKVNVRDRTKASLHALWL